MMQQTSLEAYNEIVISEKLNKMQETIYQTIMVNPGICDREISQLTGIRINSVVPRRNELSKKQFIKQTGNKVYLGRRHLVWQTT